MPRQARSAPGGLVYHVLNRANGRAELFRKPADYEAFERIMEQAHARLPTRLLAYCLMPNHWHMLIHPREDTELSNFLRWLTVTHAQRLHAHRHTAGHGHIYQGRFKSFPIQRDEHFLTVCRYVERNPLRAGLVRSAENWRWSSLRWHAEPANERWILGDWPVERPRRWVDIVNRPQSAHEEQAVRRSIKRSSPFGAETWRTRTAKRLGLEWTLRPRGRPRVRDTAQNKSDRAS